MPRAFPSLCLSGVAAPLSLVRSDDGPQRTTIASITTVTTPSPHLRAPPPSTLIAKPWCLRSGSVGLVHDLTPLDCLRGGLRIEGCGQSPFSAAAQCARLQGLMNPGPANLASVKCQKKELLKKVDVDIQIFLGSNYLVRPLLRKGLRPARPQTIQQRLSSFSMREKKTIRSLMRASVEQNSPLDRQAEALLKWKSGLLEGGSSCLDSWTKETSPCNWTGVDCSTTGPRGRYQGDRVPVVSNISVSMCGSPLNGTLDRLHFAEFPHLLYLDLRGNSLSGTIPSSTWSLSELVFLDLSYNGLNGSIPPSIGLPHLAHLGLSNNAISGRIPSNIGALAKLEYLDLSFNHLDGSIPPSIGLPHLAYLDLSHNSLSGSIPSSIGGLAELVYLDLSDNDLSGSIPRFIGLRHLVHLDLMGNAISGRIPSNIGALAKLEYLDLSFNLLDGSIPPSIGNCTKLTSITLSYNLFSEGPIPPSLINLKNLELIDISNSQINGSIPRSIGNLTSLQYLDLSHNQINGSIPSTLSKLISLTILALQSNQLNGILPPGLGSLVLLSRLHLSGNQLSGGIPPEIGHCHSLL
ncbi:hypothetical protein QYE76_008955 [Lolium multiflorum]|uniref:Leucine-rich repeat-containing N-terminal plant-type domain-containing protein n=1 Tax=Lolium multiflorum TaxID=4521 RepID=A0AAD8TU47_LOLMU|nr:hypothetical protein QYE76_008955 [Lolium multiflorum]